MPYAFMKLFMINDVYIKVFGKLKKGLECGFVKDWLNSIQITGP